LDLCEPIQVTLQPTEALQARDVQLHKPAEFPQTSAVSATTLAQNGRDTQPAQHHPQRFAVVAGIALQPLGQPQPPLCPRARRSNDQQSNLNTQLGMKVDPYD